ncbi:MAG: hypothetical protein J6S61_00005, partial [Elusimicrobiaceae bacterium]|nr:hypothetical protein [Elusimicrobiaceae bacterium]
QKISLSVRNSEARAKIPLMTLPINTSGFVLGNKIKPDVYGNIITDFKAVSQEAKDALNNKPITEDEWNQIVNFFEKLNKAGFNHGDLKHNLFFRRDDKGKLIISLVDFEQSPSFIVGNEDLRYLKTLKSQLEDIGAKEKAPKKDFTPGSWEYSIRQFLDNIPPLAPAFLIGVGLTFAFSGFSSVTSLALAAGTGFLASPFSPLTFNNSTVNESEAVLQVVEKQVRDFVTLRKKFSPVLFDYVPLPEGKEESVKIKKLIGENFYNLWQKYVGKNLKQLAQENPQDLLELIKYSNRYENTLPSRMNNIYGGTNPLFVFGMRDITNNLIQNLSSGLDMESVINALGKDINEYHRKLAQTKLFSAQYEGGVVITWDFLEDLSNSSINYFIPDLYFGRFRFNKDNRSNTVNEDAYPEYLQDMLESKPKEDLYQGLKLSTVFKAPYINLAIVEHPNFCEQRELFFRVMQNEWDIIKPLTDKVQSGQILNNDEKTKLHRHIATISYIFTNVMPFQRGSASANLALVYGIYQMAGIDAPQVKIGRALDLSAFALTIEDYIANWLNLFDGDFIDIPQKPLNLKTDIKKAIEVKFGVVQLMDSDGKVRAYYKETLESELDRTKLFNEIVQNNKLQDKYPLIGIEYPQIISTNLSDLPDEIVAMIKSNFLSTVTDYIKSLFHPNSSYKDMIIDVVNTRGFWGNEPEILSVLKGKPITNEEWAQVVSLIKDLNNAGFYHTDLGNNLFFRRDDQNKLIITIIDFEDREYNDDIGALERIRINLEHIGAKQESALSNITEQENTNKFLSKLPSWVLPAVGIGLLAFSLINPATAPFALATVPLVGSVKMQDTQTKTKPSSEVEKYIDLRGKFNHLYFSGKPLTKQKNKKEGKQEYEHMRKILGADFFDLWQTFYNKDLYEMAIENPELIKELAYYSKLYETTLPSQEEGKFPGTNPLFILTMRDLTNNFKDALNSGKTVEQAMTELGEAMFEYQKKMYQIKSFLYFRNIFNLTKD